MTTSSKKNKKQTAEGITAIAVSGYKSLAQECKIEIRPLTILAGANSSGKSSIMQPLLLMKQTLEATYDPGSLLLNGPHVRFTLAEQLFSHVSGKHKTKEFSITIEKGNDSLQTFFNKIPKKELEIIRMDYIIGAKIIKYIPQMSHEEILKIIPQPVKIFYGKLTDDFTQKDNDEQQLKWMVNRNRCFFEAALCFGEPKKANNSFIKLLSSSPAEEFEPYIRHIIHVPGLRGNPARTYNTTAVGSEFNGTFENYVASVVNDWQKTKDKRLKELDRNLETLGLTCKVEAKQVDDTQVELLVGRLPTNSKQQKADMVSIADVGFGVSQTLPVLVALLVAEPGHLVYLEQPEIHLHPRAQVRLAEILANAANRGVKIVLETHSELLLLAIQTLVAEAKLSLDKVKLHWFKRKEDGVTEVKSADLDETGAFGDWPEDFGDVSLTLQSRYMDAAEARLWNRSHDS